MGIARPERRLTTQQFVEKARAKHGDTYLYHLVDYKFGHVKVDIVCTQHGVFSMAPGQHLQGQGCTRCGDAANGISQRKTTAEFIQESLAVFGNLCDYSLVEYVTALKKIKIKCTTHGIFEKIPNKHLGGQGCPHCVKSGFKTDRQASLYVLQDDNIIKIGITNRSVKDRARTIRKSSGKAFKIVSQFKFESGQEAAQVEETLLNEMSVTYKQPDFKYDGYKESFYDVNLAALLNRIESLISEQHSSQLNASQEA